MNKLANFICVGAQKSGTTTLHDILKQHPDIYLPLEKEAHFFDVDSSYRKGVDYWMKSFVTPYCGQKCIGDITPEYLFYEKVPERIRKTLGDNIKIIILLRNPIDRAYSHYLMSKRRGYEKLSFIKAIESEKERMIIDDFHFNHFSYISRGLYFKQIKRYIDIFKKENILILHFEDDIVKNIDQSILKITDFLDLEYVPLKTNVRSNVASKTRFLLLRKLISKDSFIKNIFRSLIKSKQTRIRLLQYFDNLNNKKIHPKKISTKLKAELMNRYFKTDIQRLEELINFDLSSWYNK